MRFCCLCLAIAAMCFIPESSNGQTTGGKWEILANAPPAPTLQRHDDITFVDNGIGWLVNTTGHIYKTVDHGENWEQQKHDPSLTFRSTAFFDDQVGYVGLVNSEPFVLYETVDGGLNWTNISATIGGPIVQGLCGMQAVSDSMMVGVGAFWGAPRFLLSTDRGDTWTSKDLSSHAATLVDVHFFDEQTGIATGGDGSAFDGIAVILMTVDGGSSWDVVHRTTRAAGVDGEWGWKITVPSDSVVYASVEYNGNETAEAKILKSVDRGHTWAPIFVTGSVDFAGLQGIGFLTEELGWVGGRGTTSVTTDGGQSWSQVAPYHPTANPAGELDPRLNRMYILSDSVGYAVGSFAYTFVPSEPVAVEPHAPAPKEFSIEQNYPNPLRTNTTIAFTLHRPLDVHIRVYGPTGRLVRTLMNRTTTPPGRYELSWDSRDQSGRNVASGLYFYTADIGDSIEMKKMILIR
ncbi:MAG: T9SS type A sorting domain-containing protein [Rhodothermales bacterium]|nr:T9SS type A sorting domain-containing protein [Rhodothermales bacterium]